MSTEASRRTAAPSVAAVQKRERCPGCRLDEICRTNSGIPYVNFIYIWIVCLCSTLPIQSLFPYIYFMIRDMKIAKQEQDIGFYAGFLGASYFLARTISSVAWGMFADKYGRKPCILISILSVIVFNTLFGLSTTYWMAIVTRGLLGLLCGILGPIKAYASEVCRKEHQALGISFVTSSRAIALVVGPAIGGFLSQSSCSGTFSGSCRRTFKSGRASLASSLPVLGLNRLPFPRRGTFAMGCDKLSFPLFPKRPRVLGVGVTRHPVLSLSL